MGLLSNLLGYFHIDSQAYYATCNLLPRLIYIFNMYILKHTHTHTYIHTYKKSVPAHLCFIYSPTKSILLLPLFLSHTFKYSFKKEIYTYIP